MASRLRPRECGVAHSESVPQAVEVVGVPQLPHAFAPDVVSSISASQVLDDCARDKPTAQRRA